MASEPVNERDPKFHHPIEHLYDKLGFFLISIYRNPEQHKDHIDSDVARLKKNYGPGCIIIIFTLGDVARVWVHLDAYAIELKGILGLGSNEPPRIPMPTISPPETDTRVTLMNIPVVKISEK